MLGFRARNFFILGFCFVYGKPGLGTAGIIYGGFCFGCGRSGVFRRLCCGHCIVAVGSCARTMQTPFTPTVKGLFCYLIMIGFEWCRFECEGIAF